MPKFPAIEIEDKVVFQGCDVLQDQLEEAIREQQRTQRSCGKAR